MNVPVPQQPVMAVSQVAPVPLVMAQAVPSQPVMLMGQPMAAPPMMGQPMSQPMGQGVGSMSGTIYKKQIDLGGGCAPAPPHYPT